MAGFIVMNPYQTTRRAELDCGAVCLGSMTSAYSALGLIGAPLAGALSDSQGRRFALVLGTVASIVSLAIAGATYSLVGMWLSLIPGALLSHNFTVTKAVVADLAPHENRAVPPKAVNFPDKVQRTRLDPPEATEDFLAD